MAEKIPENKPEKKDEAGDNARKFLVDRIDDAFLDDRKATSFVLTVDWLETAEDSEKKIAYKKFRNGEVQILLIAKVTKDGNRTSVKEPISEEKYVELKALSVLLVEKTRHEFKYEQKGITFALKYDEFANSQVRILEVDAQSEEDRAAFTPEDFPSKLREVTGEMQYYGYRVSTVL